MLYNGRIVFKQNGGYSMGIEEKILKEILIEIKNNDFLLENQDDYCPLGLEMLNNIGSLDPELRDKLIYTTLFHWITKGRFTSEQLKQLLNICLDNSHLFYKLHDSDEDAVFKRTFSVLVVALIVYVHREKKFLSEEILFETKDKLVEYMHTERDVRGYVGERGWAHSAAHTADALDEFIQCSCFNKKELLEILNSIKAKVCIGYYVYIDEESERMVNAVESAFNRKIFGNSELIDWLLGFRLENPNNKDIESYHLKVNIKDFLRSLYFRLLGREDSVLVVEEIKKLLKDL
jgi:hypothetical protein